jgi:hypothetical protein
MEFPIQRLISELNLDLADIMDERNNFLPPALWPEPWRKGGLVRRFKFKEVHGAGGNARTYVGSVVLADRFSQLKILAKILGAI